MYAPVGLNEFSQLISSCDAQSINPNHHLSLYYFCVGIAELQVVSVALRVPVKYSEFAISSSCEETVTRIVVVLAAPTVKSIVPSISGEAMPRFVLVLLKTHVTLDTSMRIAS